MGWGTLGKPLSRNTVTEFTNAGQISPISKFQCISTTPKNVASVSGFVEQIKSCIKNGKRFPLNVLSF